MANEKFYVTQEGYNDLVNEHENLVHKVRQEVIVELQEARAQGDLSENAEGRIGELEAMIKNAEIISEADNAEDKKTKNVVKLGSTVKILDLSDNQEVTFNIVGTIEADPFNGKLSNTTPLAEVIMDHKVGDVCTVRRVEEPYDVKIHEIK